MTEKQAVLTERRERVLVITINRPDQRNAVNAAVANGISAALDELDADAELTLGVLTGAGKGFCAGMDLKAFVAGESAWAGDRGFAGITQRSAVKPLIAAIGELAVAGGLEIALACDLIVAARGARLRIPEVKRSLVAAGEPAAAARVLLATSRWSSPSPATRSTPSAPGTWAWSTGWPSPDRRSRPLELADKVSPNAPLALAASKRILVEAVDRPDSEFFARQKARSSGPVMTYRRTRARARPRSPAAPGLPCGRGP